MATAIITILIFMVMISLHEFGHFIMAKITGIPVVEFSVGMGPAIFSKERKGTKYSLRIIPVGGYCKFIGEDGESEDEGAFFRQKIWKRFLTLVAGALFNVILGFILFMIITASQGSIVTNKVDSVVDYSGLAQAGIEKGDKIVALNGKKINFYNDLRLYLDEINSDQELLVTIKRDGRKIDYTIAPSRLEEVYTYTDNGVKYESKINGHKRETQEIPYSETFPYDASMVGKTASGEKYMLGFNPVQEKVGIGNIWIQSYNMTKFVVKIVYKSIWDMIRGAVSVSEMSGPVGIVSEVNQVVTAPTGFQWENIVSLTALLTINLGIFNLLPIPALDGGRLLFVIIELIRRKPIPPEKEGMIHALGLLLMLALILFISFNDIMRLIK